MLPFLWQNVHQVLALPFQVLHHKESSAYIERDQTRLKQAHMSTERLAYGMHHLLSWHINDETFHSQNTTNSSNYPCQRRQWQSHSHHLHLFAELMKSRFQSYTKLVFDKTHKIPKVAVCMLVRERDGVVLLP